MTLKNHTPKQGVLPSDWSAAALGSSFNPGLVHQRYAGLPLSSRRGRDAKESGSDVKIVAETFRDAFRAAEAGGMAALAEHHSRMDRAALQHGWTALDIELAAPLAIGLGNEHPLENGMTFHHTLGVPFIPGTSVKGLLRAWCELFGECAPTDLATLFGNDQHAAPEDQRMGDLVFLDALPVRWPVLGLDLSNCHLQSYYRGPGGRERNPGAVPRENPVPAVFLTVQKATFRFRLGARAGSGVDVGKALAVLAEALATLGIGAKTAAGYGVFKATPAGELTSPKEILRVSSPQVTTGAGGPLFQLFLSHSSVDKADVHKLTTALTRRGAVPWLDADRLDVGEWISAALEQAIEECSAVVVLLSRASLVSPWVDGELQKARELERSHGTIRLLPALWGITEADLLADGRFAEWFTNGRLNRLVAKEASSHPEPLALAVVKAAAKFSELASVPVLQIVCDQRGDGARVGKPADRGVRADLPTLTFRPDCLERRDKDIVHGAAWVAWRDAMKSGLDAVGWKRGSSLRLHLRCQLSVAVWFGAYFDRTKGVDVDVYDNFRPDRDRTLLKADLRPASPVTVDILEEKSGGTLDLVIWHEGARVDPSTAVAGYRAGEGASGPLYSLCRPLFGDDEDVAAWAKGVAQWVAARNAPAVRLYLTTSVFAAVALGRELTKVEARSVEVMEYDFEASTYRTCKVR